MKDLNINPTKLKLIEEKEGSTLEHIDIGDLFLNTMPVSQTLRETTNKWDLLKLRSFCKAKDMVNKTKQLPTELEIFTNHTSDRELISIISREFKKLDHKLPNNPIKNGVQI